MSTEDAKLKDCPEEGEMSEECRQALEESKKAREMEKEKTREMEKKKGGSG